MPATAQEEPPSNFQLRSNETARGLHETRWPIAFSMETWNIFSRYGSRKRKESQGNAIAKCQCRLSIAMFLHAKDSFCGDTPTWLGSRDLLEIWLNGAARKLNSRMLHCYIWQVIHLRITKASRFRAFFSELCWLCWIKVSRFERNMAWSIAQYLGKLNCTKISHGNLFCLDIHLWLVSNRDAPKPMAFPYFGRHSSEWLRENDVPKPPNLWARTSYRVNGSCVKDLTSQRSDLTHRKS